RIVYRATLKQLSGLYQKKLTGACSQTHPGFPSSSVCPSPSSLLTPRRPFSLGDPALLEASVTAEIDCGDVGVLPGFVTEDESESLLVEIRRTLRGKRYLYNHWDGAIEGYRETEKPVWGEANPPVIHRLKQVAEDAGGEDVRALDEVHVLDLANDGFIRPHIDSIKFCGDVIAGLSLVSECVMVFQHEDDSTKWIRALLPPLSIYIMRGRVRHNYTHAVPLTGEESGFKGQTVSREQRVSVISRTRPPQHHNHTSH
ncbi:Alpha-ketoglutarate-dependent dioxygenase alkB homolog 7, mitochondrial, partial [Geodia barretti]